MTSEVREVASEGVSQSYAIRSGTTQRSEEKVEVGGVECYAICRSWVQPSVDTPPVFPNETRRRM